MNNQIGPAEVQNTIDSLNTAFFVLERARDAALGQVGLLREQVARLEAQLEQAQAERAAALGQVTSPTAELEQEAQVEQNDALEQVAPLLPAQLQQAQATGAAALRQVGPLREQVARLEAQLGQVRHLAAELAQETRAAASEEVTHLEAELRQVGPLREQVASLEAQLGETQEARVAASEQVTLLEAQLEETQAEQNRLRDLLELQQAQVEINNEISIQVQPASERGSLRNRTGVSTHIYSDHDDETTALLGNNTNTQCCWSCFRCNKLSELFSALVDCLH
jgi:chromosome segregation ATPase